MQNTGPPIYITDKNILPIDHNMVSDSTKTYRESKNYLTLFAHIRLLTVFPSQ